LLIAIGLTPGGSRNMLTCCQHLQRNRQNLRFQSDVIQSEQPAETYNCLLMFLKPYSTRSQCSLFDEKWQRRSY